MFDRIDKGLYWDRAWTLVGGCTPVSPACDNCWSARETHMRSFHPIPGIRTAKTGLTDINGRFNAKIRLREDNLFLPVKVKKPTVWAIWNDLFHSDVTTDFIDMALEAMSAPPILENGMVRRHIFLALTKRPENIEAKLYEVTEGNPCRTLGGGDYLSNLWLGVTAENQEQADKRIPALLRVPAARYFVSVEPMLGPVDLFKYLRTPISWVICGCESGPGARPTDTEWIRNLRDQCNMAGRKFFLKQMRVKGKLIKMPELDGRKWQELPVFNG